MSEMMEAIESFVTTLNGQEYVVKAGEVLSSDHIVVRKMPAEWFRPLKGKFEVEAASAAPGEKRAARVKSSGAADS